MKTNFLLILPLFGMAVPAMAAPAPSTAATAATKVTISGDSFTVDNDKHEATFTGKVTVVRADMTLTADRVVAHYGAGGTNSVSSFEAVGNVKIVTSQQTATGQKATLDPKTHILKLTGNVVVDSPDGRVQAPQLEVNLKTNKSTFSNGGASGRVTGVFNTQ